MWYIAESVGFCTSEASAPDLYARAESDATIVSEEARTDARAYAAESDSAGASGADAPDL